MKPDDISVIIPALNEARNIDRCIRSVRQAGEVIVVDGGSRDQTQPLAQSAGAKVILSPAGRAVQQNAGAKLAAGKSLLFLHADNYLAADGIEQIAAALAARGERWGGAMMQRIEAAGKRYRLLERGNAMRVRFRGLPFGDQAIFVRRETFEKLGGFPDEPIMEDVILSQRLRRIAWPLLLPGPVHIDARRWQQAGLWRQTGRNLAMQAAFAVGVSPGRLRKFYPNNAEDD